LGDEKNKSSGRILCIFPCMVLRNYKPNKSCQFSGYGNIRFTWHFPVIDQMLMSFT